MILFVCLKDDTMIHRAIRVAQVVECLPSKRDLSSSPSTVKKKKNDTLHTHTHTRVCMLPMCAMHKYRVKDLD
jgi:hypothetical protein